MERIVRYSDVPKILVLVCMLAFCAGCSEGGKGSDLQVAAIKYRLFSSGGISNRYEVDTTVAIKNNGNSNVIIDRLEAVFMVNGKSMGGSRVRFRQLIEILPGASEEQGIRSMASGFGDYVGSRFKKEIHLSLFHKEKIIYGPAVIKVSDTFGY
jgi:hypothetical protein